LAGIAAAGVEIAAAGVEIAAVGFGIVAVGAEIVVEVGTAAVVAVVVGVVEKTTYVDSFSKSPVVF